MILADIKRLDYPWSIKRYECFAPAGFSIDCGVGPVFRRGRRFDSANGASACIIATWTVDGER